MKEILILVIVYLGYLFVWFVVNLLAYFASLVFKKKKIINGLAGISVLVSYFLSFILGIIMLMWMISVLLDGQILLFLLLFIFGAGLITSLITYLQAPFVAIPMFFTEKVKEIDFDEDIVEAEILDKDDRVIGKTEGDTTISIRLAKYFLVFYGLNLTWLLISPEEHEGLLLLDYVTIPFTQMIGGTIMVGLPYAIYHRIRYKSFFPEDKRYFFTNTWKFCVYIFGILMILVAILTFLLRS